MASGMQRKRGRDDDDDDNRPTDNRSSKKSKQEMEPSTSGRGISPKPCNRFYSTSGCRFEDRCNFSHNVRGGLESAAEILGYNPAKVDEKLKLSATTSVSRVTATILIDDFLVGRVMGYCGCHSMEIYERTGVIVDAINHETDPAKRYIQLAGSSDHSIGEAKRMVHRLMATASVGLGPLAVVEPASEF
ncbi:zinc finger CCCH domain-containing protein 52-like [Andrographis paniculata]|uniref:zinc finger CCCH domain-containing protein 52-like n=1 Tax=Andrographis paniculata TaxID=175694 RepID=UPI0021E7E579|nr:zinc finger CCCH domain-containing protein 52-like [Andrographis paniculata]